MIDSLFDNKTGKTFNKIAKKKATIAKKEDDAVELFLNKTSPETMREVFNIIENNGHPNEKVMCEKIKNKYDSSARLEFDDIMTLEKLYKSNYSHSKDSDKINE